MISSRSVDAPELDFGIDHELLAQGQRPGIAVTGLSATQLRLHLEKVDPTGAEDRARRWAAENAEAIKEHNRFVEEHGLLSDHLRTW